MGGKDKIYVSVMAQPRSRKPGIEKLSSGEYRVRVAAAPVRGEANREVVEALASHLGLPPSRLKIVRGEKSRRKLIMIDQT